MAKCLVCNRQMYEGTTIKHHLYWPKKKHRGRNPTIELHVKCEKTYHAYYFQFCSNGSKHACARCRFTIICCYAE
jgi:hypothetical protein